MARRRLSAGLLAKAFAFAFFLYLPTRNAVRYDFHVDLLADPLILAAFYLVLTKRWRWLTSVMGALLLIKENMTGVVFAFGVYLFAVERKRGLGLALAIGAPLALVLETRVLVERVLGMSYYHGGLYSRSFPVLLTENFLSPASAAYVVKMFGPLAFLSLLSPSTLILAAPVFFQNTFSRLPQMRSIFFHYSSGLTAAVFVSAIEGARRVLSGPFFEDRVWRPLGLVSDAQRQTALAGLITAASLLAAGVSEYHIARVHWGKRDAHVRKVHRYLERIPKEASVRTHRYFAPHLANRRYLYDFDDHNPTQGRSPDALAARYAVIDRRYVDDFAKTRRHLAENGYHPVVRDEGFYIFEKGARVP